MSRLYFGDNIDVLRNEFGDNTFDLIYLDPPFNSKRDYNLIYKTPAGHKSDAQITAFKDSWWWGEQAEKEFSEVVSSGRTDVAEMLSAFRRFLGENDVMAYLTMMGNRLIELNRVLKKAGSLYLHCDPTASHYLKILLDAVFGKANFKNEIIWKRTNSHSSAKRWGPIHDVIFFYTKSDVFLWNDVFVEYDAGYVKEFYRHIDEGGAYQLIDLTGPGLRKGDSGLSWKGVNPSLKNRHWAIPRGFFEDYSILEEKKPLTTQEKLEILEKKGLVVWPKKGEVPRFKKYLDLSLGKRIQDIVADIPPVSSHSSERLNYPTQKPVALLERILLTSSNPGDLVLDPFCGCGTTLLAAQKLKREWVGIDITHLAITLIEKRLRDAFLGIEFEVFGAPKDMEGAVDLAKRDKYQFQWWACSLVNAQPYQGKKKGADGGVDGLIFFQDDIGPAKKIIVSVKGGDQIGVGMIRELKQVIKNQEAEIGFFISLREPTAPMTVEAAAEGFYVSPLNDKQYPRIQILTIKGLLEDGIKPRYPESGAVDLTFKKTRKVNQKPDRPKLI